MKAFRAISMLLFVLVFATGSVTMSMARNQPRAIGDIELCTGNGLVSVSIDADGNPTGPLMPCPDATMALAALTDVSLPVVQTPAEFSPAAFQLRDVPSTVVTVNTHRLSRAPPVLV